MAESGDDGMNELFALIRCALWGTAPEPDFRLTGEALREVVQQARRQSVSVIVASVLMDHAETLGIGQETLRKLHAYVLGSQRMHLRLNSVLAEVTTMLEREGINSVLLKGQGVAMNYPQPTYRICGDIDLYVGEENFARACDVLRREGSDPEGIFSLRHWHTDYKEVQIEIHRIADTIDNLRGGKAYQRWCAEQLTGTDLQSLAVEGRTVSLPPITFNAFYIFHHAWHHFLAGGIGLRQLCDWAIHLHTYRDSIDRELLKAWLTQYDLLEPWQTFAAIAVDKLGLPADECPLYDPSFGGETEMIVGMIMADGNFGHYSPIRTERPKGYFSGKLHTWRLISRRMTSLLRVVPRHAVKYYIIYLYTGIKAIIDDKL
jgi:hypothetical protein